MPVFIAELFTIAKIWEQPQCPSVDDWIQKLWYVYTMDYYVVIKREEIFPIARAWMDLKITRLSEINHSEKDKYYMIPLTCGI